MVRGERNARRLAQGNRFEEPGNTPFPVNVAQHACIRIGIQGIHYCMVQARQGLAPDHRNMQGSAQLRIPGPVVLLQRLLVPVKVESLERLPDQQGVATVVAFRRVEHQAGCRASRLPERPSQLDISPCLIKRVNLVRRKPLIKCCLHVGHVMVDVLVVGGTGIGLDGAAPVAAQGDYR